MDQLTRNNSSIFADVAGTRLIQEEFFGPLDPSILVDLNMFEGVFMSA